MKKDLFHLNSIWNHLDLYENKIEIEEGIELLIQENKTTESGRFWFKNNIKNDIQIHFCDAGNCKIGRRYESDIELTKGTFLLSNTGLSNLMIQKNTKIITLTIDHQKFCEMFGGENVQKTNFVCRSIENNVFMLDKTSPVNCVVLSQITQSLAQNKSIIYIRAKVYELICVFLHQLIDAENEVCPYFKNKENLEKLKKAKLILENNISEPPNLIELSKIVMLPFSKLQKGFKEVYGYTLYDYLRHYKMTQAVQLLKRNNLSIQEIALEIGYSTSSHFITAFRKKFGTTPKRYVANLK